MSSFLEFILDQLHFLEGLRYRKMFRSYGLYLNDVFFGIVSDGRFYIKTNKETRKKYESLGMKVFAVSEKQVLKNYFEVPIEIIEDRDSLKSWVMESIKARFCDGGV